MKKKSHYIRLLALLLLIAVLAGCAKHARREIPGPEESFRKAMNLFERERYYRAQELFRDIALNYSGSAIIDSTKFYLGLTYEQLEEYDKAIASVDKALELGFEVHPEFLDRLKPHRKS